MRSFIRHPSDVPIDFRLDQLVSAGSDYLKNVSRGGLATEPASLAAGSLSVYQFSPRSSK